MPRRNRTTMTGALTRACRALGAGVLLAFAAIALPVHAQPRPSQTADFDADVRAVIERYQLPGIALAVVRDGQVVYRNTSGELIAGSGSKVSDASLFKIASNSKAFTGALLARLVQQGKLRWDDPVVRHLPQFAMFDPWVTREMQVRDLLIHNSGLPLGGGDLMLWPEPNLFTRADILRGLRHIAPDYSFRAGYAYDNVLYVVAGEVAAAAGGASYEELIRREIFQPLGLDGCRVGEFALAEAGEVAQPHRREGDRNVVVNADPPVVPEIASAAAGGIRCDLDSMLAWMRGWLDPTPAQLQWLDAAQRAEMVKGRTMMPLSRRKQAWENAHTYAYGYGFRVSDFHGAWTVSHTGTLNGMYSMMMLLPDSKSGFVFMINGPGDSARTILAQVLTERLVRGRTTRSVASLAGELARPSGAASASRMPDLAPAVALPADAMPALIGVWRDPWLGEVRICRKGDGLQFDAAKSPRLTGPLQLLDGRAFVRWSLAGVDPPAWVDVAGEGDARTMRMAKVDPDADFSSDFEHLSFRWVRGCDDAPAAASPVRTSPARTPAQAGLSDIATLVPGIATDIRYFGSHNFVGRPVDGYQAPKCYLLTPVAQALARVEAALRPQGLRLKIFDCYRPVRAVAHFMRWVDDAADTRTKAEFYPDLDKPALRGEYIAPVSGHSRGATVDLTLLQCDAGGGDCRELDMGTPFDFFGARANTDHPHISAQQRANRDRLRLAMADAGFANYPMEWWHFTLRPEPSPGLQFDVPVR